ncbi:zeta toxin family protein [Patescibacteria group bacterium]|nr:zeta toxin family protein [Patescibacteria group bacterium]MBU4016743.1 zeta toxin family protein [Patescibacteria group bacterium]MBU4098263.1 zeta toxin family protein [Patescibacteria group bacterium]
MSDDTANIEEQAKEWVRQNKRVIIDKFANLNVYPGVSNPFTIFMAGSPGAGKTEFSKSFIKDYDPGTKIVRIDADEIRDLIPGYTGQNAYKVQGAAAIGVEKLFDYIQNHHQNAIMDGTFSDYKISKDNVERSLHRDRSVGIFYLYQEPKVAWEFTKIREVKEKRHVSKAMFINSFFAARDNVNKIKQEFGKAIELNLVIKNFENKLEKTQFKIDKVENYIDIKYTMEELSLLLT